MRVCSPLQTWLGKSAGPARLRGFSFETGAVGTPRPRRCRAAGIKLIVCGRVFPPSLRGRTSVLAPSSPSEESCAGAVRSRLDLFRGGRGRAPLRLLPCLISRRPFQGLSSSGRSAVATRGYLPAERLKPATESLRRSPGPKATPCAPERRWQEMPPEPGRCPAGRGAPRSARPVNLFGRDGCCVRLQAGLLTPPPRDVQEHCSQAHQHTAPPGRPSERGKPRVSPGIF